LRERGYDSDAVRSQVAARRWTTCGRRVVVLQNGPLTERQQRWVAVLAQPGGGLTGVTGASELGLTGFSDPLVHVVIPHGSRPHSLPGVRVHVSRRLSEEDLHPGRALPTVRLERALVDAAAQTRLPRLACALFAAGVQQRLTTAQRLTVELGRAGRRRWLDAEFDGFFVEVDGAVHLRPLSYWDDMDRQNDLVIVTGRPILRFATVAIRLASETVEAQLRAAADRFGRLAS
jgi:hypothetical protein